MTDADRDRCRALQDRWLALPAVQAQIRNHGEDRRIAGHDSPTFRDVRTLVLPWWQGFFQEFFE